MPGRCAARTVPQGTVCYMMVCINEPAAVPFAGLMYVV